MDDQLARITLLNTNQLKYIYQNILVNKDSIIVERAKNGIVGLYDKVEGKFYSNSADSGSLSKG